MAERPKKKRWMTTALPAELMEEIRAHIAKDPKQEYASTLEFVRDAVREKLDEVSPNRRAGGLADRLDHLKPDAERAGAKIRANSPSGGRGFCRNCGAALHGSYCSNCGTKAI